jgi:uncharacterized protein YaiE (UPF0345 family)
MFNVNEYFEGKVKSISFENANGEATIGVMAKGEYEFGTSTKEIMEVISGEMKVKLPNSDEWLTITPGEVFEVDKDQKFLVDVVEDTAYMCLYK